MKLIDANKNKVVIEFTNEEFLALSTISSAVREDFGSLDAGMVDSLEQDHVDEFSNSVSAILHELVTQDKYLKD